MANKILILFAHPRFEQSRSNQILVNAIPKNPHITFHDLYELYPDFNIDITLEKILLVEHDIIIWQHPLYWYSAPPLLKQWIDMVLEFGWAYGRRGNALKGKLIFNTFTSGGPRTAYKPTGRNVYTIQTFLTPFEQTARFCNMEYLPPFGVQGTHKLSEEALKGYASEYRRLLERLIEDDFSVEDLKTHEFLNDWLQLQHTTKS